MSKLCTSCGKEHNRKVEICQKCYLRAYHIRNFKKKEIECAICGVISQLGHKKYCDGCIDKIKSVCEECGKEFFYGAKYKYCTSCVYHRMKKSDPEWHKEYYDKAAQRQKIKLRRDICAHNPLLPAKVLLVRLLDLESIGLAVVQFQHWQHPLDIFFHQLLAISVGYKM